MTVNGREAISAAQASNGAVGLARDCRDTRRYSPDDKKTHRFFYLPFYLPFFHPFFPPLCPSIATSAPALVHHLLRLPSTLSPRSLDTSPPTPRPPHPLQPRSLFLANLKFVRRLRLLDGWPLIFCELHLAQTSRRPPCILLTAALVAGPRHLSQPRPPNASSLQEPRHQLNPPPPRRLRACKHT